MRRFWRSIAIVAAVFGAVLAYGYWHARTHAALHIQVSDVALRSAQRAAGDAHDVRLRFFDQRGVFLATAHSIEPAGYILAVHPDSAIGDCRAYAGNASASLNRGSYSRCYAAASKWYSEWAPRAAFAEVAVGACVVRAVPVEIETYAADWWLWWVPLPHVGGTARRYITLRATIDSKLCAAAR